MRPLHSLPLAGVMVFAVSGAMSAELGQHYDSYRDMHEKTQYGTLFFNEGAIRHDQDLSLKRFATVIGDGELILPAQEGYCFVFNHYQSPNGNSTSHKYQGEILKWFKNGRRKRQVVKSTFTPASHDWSPDLPDLCINGIENVTKISIVFSSDDESYFDRSISFALK
jgi:hypothetical protein